MIPESEKKINDLITLVSEGFYRYEDVIEDGELVRKAIMDHDKVNWKTHDIASNKFGACVFDLKELERIAIKAQYNMSAERAQAVREEILEFGQSIRYSIDAKNSESVKDKHNGKSTLIDKISRNKSERVYKLDDDSKRSALDRIINRDKERDQEYD